MNEISLLALFFLISSCGERVFELSDIDRGPNPSEDNTAYRNGTSFYYSLTYMSPKSEAMFVVMPQQSIAFDDPLIFADTLSDYDKNFIVKKVKLSVKKTSATNAVNQGQTNVLYEYQNMHDQVIPYASLTGVVDNSSNVWLHPPRNSTLKILNLSAYPFAKLPLIKGQTWSYRMPVDRKWGSVDLKNDWKSKDVILTHTYKVTDEVNFLWKDESKSGYKIRATTTSSLGESISEFFFVPNLGFVKMEFRLTNGGSIVLQLISMDQ